MTFPIDLIGRLRVPKQPGGFSHAGLKDIPNRRLPIGSIYKSVRVSLLFLGLTPFLSQRKEKQE